MIHPAINRQKGKWEIEEIFKDDLNDPSFTKNYKIDFLYYV